MDDAELDDVDKAILYALQEDARNISSGDIAERTGTSDSTVRKRIHRLESEGVISGYSADVDYEKSGYPIRMMLFCTASIPERGDLITDILATDAVVSVQELVTGEQNLLVTAVGKSDSEITPVAQKLLDMGLTVADEVLVRSHETTPYNFMGGKTTVDDIESIKQEDAKESDSDSDSVLNTLKSEFDDFNK